jgi:hypothetical protein
MTVIYRSDPSATGRTLFHRGLYLVDDLFAAQGGHRLQEALFCIEIDERSSLLIISFEALRNSLHGLICALHCRSAALNASPIGCRGLALDVVNLLTVRVRAGSPRCQTVEDHVLRYIKVDNGVELNVQVVWSAPQPEG